MLNFGGGITFLDFLLYFLHVKSLKAPATYDYWAVGLNCWLFGSKDECQRKTSEKNTANDPSEQ